MKLRYKREMPDLRSIAANRILKVEFFKRDELTTDLVCCEIVEDDKQGPKTWFFHEEASDWGDLLELVEQLPGFDSDWRGKVIQPAFAENRTIAFVRQAMYRVTLACEAVPTSAGPTAAKDIQKEFSEHRPHHQNVVCTYTNGELVLTAENDFDPNGLALMDEFSDCISAHITELFDGQIRVVETASL